MAGLFVWTYLGVGLEGVNEVRGELDGRVAFFASSVSSVFNCKCAVSRAMSQERNGGKIIRITPAPSPNCAKLSHLE